MNSLRLTLMTLLVAASNVFADTHYVSHASRNPTPPYASWDKAATNIQDAVNSATNGDLVLVTNGIYRTGVAQINGTNRLAVLRPLAVRSVNGPDATVIEGDQNLDIRGVYLVSGASLAGFTVTNGAAAGSLGGGVLCDSFDGSVISNCVIVGNSSCGGGGAYGGHFFNCKFIANNSCSGGGAALSASLFNCLVANNSASQGGGAFDCVVQNCIVLANSAGDGGGLYGGRAESSLIVSNLAGGFFGGGAANGTALVNCTIAWNQHNSLNGGKAGGVYQCNCYNSIVYYNSDWAGFTYQNYYRGSWSNCCTTPLPASGAANFTNAPLFVNPGVGDFHLQTASPCINAGNRAYDNLFDPVVTDADGAPRLAGGQVDVGAYELQNPASIISYVWLMGFGLATDGSADFIDSDGDGMNNWQEWIAGTDPTNPLSALRMLAPTSTVSGITVRWQSVSGVTYYLLRSTSLGLAFTSLAMDIPGQPGTTSYDDTSAPGPGPIFYRVGVQR